jgi:hypothetical protein
MFRLERNLAIRFTLCENLLETISYMGFHRGWNVIQDFQVKSSRLVQSSKNCDIIDFITDFTRLSSTLTNLFK